MSSLTFAKSEISAAIARGVRQCVVIGSKLPLIDILRNVPELSVQFLNVEEEPPVPFVAEQHDSEALAKTLETTEFDKLKTSLFIWLGSAGYRTVEAVMSSLAFIASLPKGSGVLFDYAVERASLGSLTCTALDALASRVPLEDGSVKYLIQPQAVNAMLRGIGFQHIVDWGDEEPASGSRLISAAV